MNIVLWVLQILLALHTAMGAGWKFFNSPEAVPSLRAIPPAVWLGLSVVELVIAVALVLPALHRPLAILAPIAALGIVAEMIVFSGIHLASGEASHGQMIYWLVVAVIGAFIAYGRIVLSPW